jgi:hypothetical protein
MVSLSLYYLQKVSLKMTVQHCWHSSTYMCVKFGVKETKEEMGRGVTIQHTNKRNGKQCGKRNEAKGTKRMEAQQQLQEEKQE